MLHKSYTAVEFFSGIGAFGFAVAGNDAVRIVAAFDQNADANAVYLHNFGLKPLSRNLDSIKAVDIPEADVWWLSPPCTPFSRRGKQLDTDDKRALAFLNLLALLPGFLPQLVLLENVAGFIGSEAEALLIETLTLCGYAWGRLLLCPSQFGIPCLRPRVFYAACRTDRFRVSFEEPVALVSAGEPLCSYLDAQPPESCILSRDLQERYERSLDVIEDATLSQARTICFTSGYGRTMKAGGSFLRLIDGSLRRFSPEEIVRLLGFSPSFQFPSAISSRSAWRLAGNSVDITCLRFLLRSVGLI